MFDHIIDGEDALRGGSSYTRIELFTHLRLMKTYVA